MAPENRRGRCCGPFCCLLLGSDALADMRGAVSRARVGVEHAAVAVAQLRQLVEGALSVVAFGVELAIA